MLAAIRRALARVWYRVVGLACRGFKINARSTGSGTSERPHRGMWDGHAGPGI
jgi:hypothetical protein